MVPCPRGKISAQMYLSSFLETILFWNPNIKRERDGRLFSPDPRSSYPFYSCGGEQTLEKERLIINEDSLGHAPSLVYFPYIKYFYLSNPCETHISPYFTDQESEAQTNQMTCPKTQQKKSWDLARSPFYFQQAIPPSRKPQGKCHRPGDETCHALPGGLLHSLSPEAAFRQSVGISTGLVAPDNQGHASSSLSGWLSLDGRGNIPT